MTKTYTSKTEVSFNVRVDDAWVHVGFVPLTLGGSYFTTSDTRLQEAIERHRFFGRWVTVAPQAPAADHPSENDAGKPSGGPQPISFGSLADAKEWVAAEYGISRTLLRTRAQIEAVALDHGKILTIDNPSTQPRYDYMERP